MTAQDATARIAARIAARAAAEQPDVSLDELLARGLSGNELTSLLLHALRQRAFARTFADVRAHVARMTMTHAGGADGRRLHAVDGVVLAAASAFDAVELAPVHPLGASTRAGVDPNHVLTTARLAEVAADPTTGLALHALRRRDAGEVATLRLFASQRVLRLNPIDNPAFSPHFRLIGLLTAARSARASDDEPCERRALREHLAVWAAAAAALPAAGFDVAGFRVVLADTRVVRACLAARGLDGDEMSRRAVAHRPGSGDRLAEETLADLPRAAADPIAVAAALALPAQAQAIVRAIAAEVMSPLRDAGVQVDFDFARLQGLGYYTGPFVQLHVRRSDGLELPMGDGGALPWLQELRSDRRERMVSTGVGAELLVKLFDRARPPGP